MKNGTVLKPSKYIISCVDGNGDLLLCNFVKGISSFCKIDKSEIAVYNSLINNQELLYDENISYHVDLFNRGYFFSEANDEIRTIKSNYYNYALSAPVKLTVMPTENCNFRCKYCYETFEKGKMNQEDQVSLLKFIQNSLTTAPSVHVSWFGGEPLEAIDVVYYVLNNVKEMCAKRYRSYSSGMTTNGYNLDLDTFDELYKLKVYGYQITLDGLKEQHDSQRIKADGSGTFDKIFQNLLKIKNSEGYKLARITVRVNVTRDISFRLDEFIKFYEDYFGNDERFNVRFAITGKYTGLVNDNFENKLMKSEDIYECLEEHNIYENDKINLTDYERFFTPMNLICYASRKNSYIVGSDLTLYKCTIHFDKEENNIGKILKNGKLSLNHDLHNRWYLIDDLQNIEKRCIECFYFPCCLGISCPLKTNFDVLENRCTMSHLKKRLPRYLLYVSNKWEFAKISMKN